MVLRIFSLILVGFLVLFSACSKDEEEGGGGGNENPSAADTKVQEANAALEQALNTLINSEPQQPEDIDLSQPYNLYMEALGYSASHVGANFGAGVLEVMMLTRDAEVQVFFDRMKAFMDSGAYFEVQPGAHFLGGTVGLSDPIFRLQDLTFPISVPLKLTRRMCQKPNDNDPQFSDLQNLCLNKLMPRLETAVNRLQRVSESEGFTFTVTPLMQGDPNEDPLEIDQTEIRLTLASLQAVEAILWHFCAYNLDIGTYDGDGMLAALTLGSSFARLHPEGQVRMSSARNAWLAAIDDLGQAIHFLENETDYQGDDIIRLDPYDHITQANLDSIKYYMPLIQNALQSSQTFAFDLDGNEETPAEQVQISLNAFFSSPIQDLKALFPAYTVSLDTQGVDWTNVWGTDSVTATVQISTSNYYSWYRYGSYEYGLLLWGYDSRPFAAPLWDQAFDTKVQQFRDSPYCYLSIYYYDYLSQGTHALEAGLDYYYDEPTQQRYVPRITWQANSFNEWILPDPTFGGLFPGMTDSRFKQIVGMTAEGWEKTSTWYLW
jgi:hypothetical protein